jgi:hypothetical protein
MHFQLDLPVLRLTGARSTETRRTPIRETFP